MDKNSPIKILNCFKLSFRIIYTNKKTAPNETRASAQIVLFKEAKEKYQINKFILSSWSPPYKWKTMPGVPFGR